MGAAFSQCFCIHQYCILFFTCLYKNKSHIKTFGYALFNCRATFVQEYQIYLSDVTSDVIADLHAETSYQCDTNHTSYISSDNGKDTTSIKQRKHNSKKIKSGKENNQSALGTQRDDVIKDVDLGLHVIPFPSWLGSSGFLTNSSKPVENLPRISNKTNWLLPAFQHAGSNNACSKFYIQKYLLFVNLLLVSF